MPAEHALNKPQILLWGLATN